MNTNHLKKFAQEARRKLLEQVGAKLNFVLTTDSAELREKTEQLKQLRQELGRTSKEQVIEKVAYTWFNRLMALRFMDVNDYQPLGIRIITPKDGYTIPELLDEAKRGNIPEELKVNRQKIYDLLDNRIPSKNPQNEAFKELLIASCNHLHTKFPFLFERINDYTELLLPNDLTSDFSIVKDIRDGMAYGDCKDVEIIGWLYQFYISEEKERLINAKKKYKENEIAPVTQLFTPKWIVQYMVDNTLGHYWKEARPNTSILKDLEFYFESDNENKIPIREVKSPEEITFFDPCVGSAHVLCYAFDIFYKIYEEEGFNNLEIPEFIITKNLYGIDIDDRAAQLAGFALMMKGRQYNRRFLNKGIVPNITAYQNIEFHPKFKFATTLGSLINIDKKELSNIIIEPTSIFHEQQKQLLKQANYLTADYNIIVTNPPYLNNSYMDGILKQFVEEEYEETKTDLFSCFLSKYINKLSDNGYIGFICPYVWMFLKSYTKLREIVLDKTCIESLIQLEYNAFGPAVVPISTFVLKKIKNDSKMGTYIKLSSFKGVENQPVKTLEAIKNPSIEYRYSVAQSMFKFIEDYPISFWASQNVYNLFKEKGKIGDSTFFKTGVTTGNNERFTRFWFEIENDKFSYPTHFNSYNSNIKWYPLNNGGEFRKWYGNNDTVINWLGNGSEIKNYVDPKTNKRKSTIRNEVFYFKESLTWSKITNYKLSLRYSPKGFIFDAVGLSAFSNKYPLPNIQGFLNSNIALHFSKLLNESMSVIVGDLVKFPFIYQESNQISELVQKCIDISKEDWDNSEISFDFHKSFLIINNINNSLEESIENYIEYWKNKIYNLHRIEEELNKSFSLLYGLNEISYQVPFRDIVICSNYTDINNLNSIDEARRTFEKDKSPDYGHLDIHFSKSQIIKEFISYFVGLTFGRYCIYKEGIILANQGESLEDFLQKIGKQKNECLFLPDEDNIIPILEEDWFEDDIVGKFYHFLKVTFGDKNFNKNLAFIEEQIGKDIRKYFIKDFYSDHIKRYKKRPIYWMFSSPKGSFNVLIYMHRYTPDTVGNILNKYLKEFIGKLNTRKEHLQHVQVTGSASNKTKAIKEFDGIEKMLIELHEYERDILYPLAAERIEIDLDDGVLVNYNKFGKAVKEVNGLNDPTTKKKVKQFDWIDTAQIR